MVAEIFTKVVWKKTTEPGVGMLLKDKRLYVVVTHSPAGYQESQYSSNVINPYKLMVQRSKGTSSGTK